MSLIEMEHHKPPQQIFTSLSSGRKSQDLKAVDHNSDDSGFPLMAPGRDRGAIELQSIKASFKLLAKGPPWPASAPAAALGT